MKISTIDRTNEKTLSDASILLKAKDIDLISIKLRPINHFPLNDEEEYRNAYVYQEEYKTIDLSLKDSLINEGWVNYGAAKAYSVKNDSYLFVKHETGPELITHLALIASSLTLAKSAIDLIITIVKTINDSNNKKKEGKESGRYYEAAAISVETRTKDKTKTIKIYKLPLNSNDLTREEVKKLLDQL